MRPEIREAIQPHYKPNPRASSDKLNDIQRAFVKYSVKRAITNRESLSTALILQTIQQGVYENIWLDNFKPTDSEDFEKYLANRMKNEKKALRRAELMQSQEDVLYSYINTSMESECSGNRDTDNQE